MTYRESGERKVKDLLIEVNEMFMCYDDDVYEDIACDFEEEYYPVINLCEELGEWNLALFLRTMDVQIFRTLRGLAENIRIIREEVDDLNLNPYKPCWKDWSD